MGSTTGDEDSQESEEEESSGEAYDNEPTVWVDQNAPANGKTPMVGSTRGGG